ncbi:MFS transporter [Nonomuraea turkmeniaca]|uniref:MFS transporter n=1 Tax=Nonomuraea turkmeniaca TaxID=103838 RepID=A0A5S4FGY5_9ACTN|nr:MFS transporter [Nonomuraea turkmeniaca]TMR19091.1 MFS transporter [Nonomuraea turkmeniaca]
MPVPAPPAALDDSPPARRREQRGWYVYDWANSAFYTTVITVFLGPYLISVATTAACAKDFPTTPADVCARDFDKLITDDLGFVSVLGADIRPAAIWGLATTVAVLLQIVFLPIAGALADHTGRKRELLGGFAFAGALAVMGLYFLDGERYMLGLVLFVLANLAYGCSIVVYDSFLPQISTAQERDRVSAQGWAIGYIGGGVLLALNLALYLNHEALGLSTGESVRISLVSSGLWWAAFTIIPLLRLRNRPVPAHETTAIGSMGGSFRQLGRTLSELRRYPLTLLFLVAYLVYNDGVQTVIGHSAAFASQALKLDTTIQIVTILMVQFVAFFGALLLGRLARVFGTKRTVLGSLVVWTAIVIVALFVQEQAVLQFMLMALLIAIVLGGTQALSRSLFSQVIPKGREAEYFSLLQISDKGSAFIGNLTITLALTLTNSYRIAIVSLVVFFIIGFVLLALTNLPKAIRAAGNEVPDRI